MGRLAEPAFTKDRTISTATHYRGRMPSLGIHSMRPRPSVAPFNRFDFVVGRIVIGQGNDDKERG